MLEFKVSGEWFKIVTETVIIDKWVKGFWVYNNKVHEMALDLQSRIGMRL